MTNFYITKIIWKWAKLSQWQTLLRHRQKSVKTFYNISSKLTLSCEYAQKLKTTKDGWIVKLKTWIIPMLTFVIVNFLSCSNQISVIFIPSCELASKIFRYFQKKLDPRFFVGRVKPRVKNKNLGDQACFFDN